MIGFIGTCITMTTNYNNSHNGRLRLAPFLTGPLVSFVPLWRMTNDKSLATELTSRRTEYRTPSRRVRLLLSKFVAAGTCLPNRCLAMDYSASSVAAGTCVNFVASLCLSMNHSGFQASCHNTFFWRLNKTMKSISYNYPSSSVNWSEQD
jgi:hypothetical protein